MPSWKRRSSEIWDIAPALRASTRSRSTSSWCPPTIMYEFGAYGLPGRFSHWTHGRAYQQMKTHVRLRAQQDLRAGDQHQPGLRLPAGEQLACSRTSWSSRTCSAHTDFFKHNAYFEHTNRGRWWRRSASTPSASASTSIEHGTRRGRELPRRGALDPGAHRPAPALPARGARPASEPRRPRRAAAYDDLWDLGAEAAADASRRKPPTRRCRQAHPTEPEKDLLLLPRRARAGPGGLAARRAADRARRRCSISCRRCRPRS